MGEGAGDWEVILETPHLTQEETEALEVLVTFLEWPSCSQRGADTRPGSLTSDPSFLSLILFTNRGAFKLLVLCFKICWSFLVDRDAQTSKSEGIFLKKPALSSWVYVAGSFLYRRYSFVHCPGWLASPSPHIANAWCYWVLSWVSILIWKVSLAQSLVELSLTSCTLSHEGN